MEKMCRQCHVFCKTSVLSIHANDLSLGAVLLPSATAVDAMAAAGIQLTHHPPARPIRIRGLLYNPHKFMPHHSPEIRPIPS